MYMISKKGAKMLMDKFLMPDGRWNLKVMRGNRVVRMRMVAIGTP